MNALIVAAASVSGLVARLQSGVLLDIHINNGAALATVALQWDGVGFSGGDWWLRHVDQSPALIPGMVQPDGTPYRGEYVPAQPEGWLLGRTSSSAGGWCEGTSVFGDYIGANLGNSPHRVR